MSRWRARSWRATSRHERKPPCWFHQAFLCSRSLVDSFPSFWWGFTSILFVPSPEKMRENGSNFPAPHQTFSQLQTSSSAHSQPKLQAPTDALPQSGLKIPGPLPFDVELAHTGFLEPVVRLGGQAISALCGRTRQRRTPRRKEEKRGESPAELFGIPFPRARGKCSLHAKSPRGLLRVFRHAVPGRVHLRQVLHGLGVALPRRLLEPGGSHRLVFRNLKARNAKQATGRPPT